MAELEKRSSFFLRNLFKGLVWLAIIVAMFIFTKHTVNPELMQRFKPFFDNTFLIIGIFCLSELIIGIIPPEFFLIWALRSGNQAVYIGWALLFTVISYSAGFIAYLFGRYLHNTRLYCYFHARFLMKSEPLLKQYGLYLILVAALTPVPFSGVSTLVGAVHYPIDRYIYWSLSRFLKFAISAWVIWQANMI